MSWFADTLAVYGRVLRGAAERTVANWPLALLAVVYPIALAVLGSVLAPYGMIGGLIWTLAAAASTSSWLHFMEQVVRGRRADLREFGASFGTYLGELINVGFLLFLLRLAGGLFLGPFPLLALLFGVAMFVFLNAVPELIYLGRHASTELLAESYRFIGQNWIEWFPLNLLLVALMFAVDAILPEGPFGLVSAAGVGLLAAFVSVARGLLFLELTTSSRRAREFRRRAAG